LLLLVNAKAPAGWPGWTRAASASAAQWCVGGKLVAAGKHFPLAKNVPLS